MTVPQLLKAYPAVLAVEDANGASVTAGAVRTGYAAVFADGRSVLAVAGDLNGSGTVNSADVKELMTLFVTSGTAADHVRRAADFHRDGTLDNRDLVLLSRAAS